MQRLTAIVREDPVPDVRREAARALGAAGDAAPGAVETLVAALEDANDGVRRAATLALGRFRDPHAAQALIRTLAAKPELWEEASAALGTTGDAGLADELLALAGHESTQVRRGAVRALAALSARGRGEVADEPLFVYTDADGHRHPLF